jgi:predicted lipoprotein with Yx(FWY)xxD motif
MVRTQEQSRETIALGSAVVPVIAALHGEAVAAQAVETKVVSSKTKVKKALTGTIAAKQKAARETGLNARSPGWPSTKAVLSEAYQALRDAGVMAVSTFAQVKEVRPAELQRANREVPALPAPEAATVSAEQG